VVKDWIASAVKPLLRLAKQHFRPDAWPISVEMWFKFKVSARCFPEPGASSILCGPETGIEGRFQVCAVAGSSAMVVLGSGAALGEGAPPMMPPSRNFMEGAVLAKREPMARAERGEMAFRSR
jgi:hypothetical protein